MEKNFLFVAAAVYALAFLAEGWSRWRWNPKLGKIANQIELGAFAIFTVAVVTFVVRSALGEEITLRRSIAWIFFAWALGGADLLSQRLYGNRTSGPFTKIWIIAAIAVLPMLRPVQFVDYFSSTLSWFNFHRIVFVLGYAFFFLALPLAVSFLWRDVLLPLVRTTKGAVIDHHLQELDHIHYHLVLWALPLLSLGLLAKILLLLDTEPLVTPEIIWRSSKEEFLGVITWFTCALYMHMRIFWRWRYSACAIIYIISLCLITVAHFSGRLLLQV